MAVPRYECPGHWTKVSLEPNARLGFIVRCESGGTPSTTNEAYWDGDVPWLTPREIAQNDETIYVSHTERRITPEGIASSAAKLLRPGTVLLTKRAPVGAVAINAVPMATNQGFLNFHCGPRLRPLFLAYWMKANREYLQQVANGSTYLELYKTDLFEFELAVPPLPEQDAIIQAIGAWQFLTLLGSPLEQSVGSEEEMLRLQAQDRRLRQLGRRLMLEFLSGRWKPNLREALLGDAR
jgi:type I restriction enzyme S subunit